MNIVSIMTELIERQKIAKRHSQGRTSSVGVSLIDAASKFRAQKIKRSSLSGFRDHGLKFSSLKKRIKPRRKMKGKSPGLLDQSIKKRNGIKAGLGKFFSSVSDRALKLDTKTLITITAVLAVGLFLAYIVNTYIDKITMFDELTLQDDANIEDVLYENLPADYSGQGSGEIAGIEPVLLTHGKPLSYTVKSGDTLSEISKNHNIKIGTLISFNKITDVRRLQVGMELKIPEYDGVPYEVKSGDSLSGVSKKYNISINSLLDANNLDSEVIHPGDVLFIPGASMNEFDYKKAMGTLFIYPTSGRLSSGFGYRPDPFTGKRRFHNGIDLANEVGTRVVATMSGLVADIGEQPLGYGKYVIIKHSNGYQSLYGHLNKINVRKGEYIYQGERLGEMGNTGRSTGPHLHFSIYKNNTPVNPLTYLW